MKSIAMATTKCTEGTRYPSDTTHESDTLLGIGKSTLRMKKLTLCFKELAKEIEAQPLVEGDFRSRFPKSDFSSAKSLGFTAEAKMWQAYRRLSVSLGLGKSNVRCLLKDINVFKELIRCKRSHPFCTK